MTDDNLILEPLSSDEGPTTASNIARTPVIRRDSTTTETLPDEEGETAGEMPTGRTWSDTFDGFFTGRTPIKVTRMMVVTPLLWSGVAIWLLVQDNNSSKLETLAGIKWFATKAIASSIIVIIPILIFAFFYAIENWKVDQTPLSKEAKQAINFANFLSIIALIISIVALAKS